MRQGVMPGASAAKVGSRALILAVVAGAYGSLDSMLNVAFPDLIDGLGIGVVDIQWIVVAYVLGSGGALIGAGRVGDLFGHQRALSWGGLVSAVGLLLCSVSPSFSLLIAGRVLQGIGTAFVMASAPALVTAAVGEEGRGRALGLFQMSAAIGLAVGPLVGGPLVDALGWRSVFWVRAPVGLALGILAGRQIVVATAERRALGGPVLLAVTLATGLVALNLSLSMGPGSPVVIALALAGLGLLIGLVTHQRAADEPVIALDLLKRPAFLVANLLAVAANGAAFVGWLFVPEYVVEELGSTALTGGLVLATAPAATAAVAPLAGRLSDRIGSAPLAAAGLGLLTAGLVAAGLVAPGGSVPRLAAALGLVGLGLGLFTVPNMAFVFGSLPEDRQGVAGGLVLTMRTVGIVVGVAVLSRFFDANQARGFGSALGRTFLAAAALMALSTMVSMVRLIRGRPAP